MPDRFQAADPDQYETVNVAMDLLNPMVRPTDYSPALWNLTSLLYTAAAGDDPAADANAYCALRRYPADPLSSIRSFPSVAHAAALADCRVAQTDLMFDVRLPNGTDDPAAGSGGSPLRVQTENGTVSVAFAGDKLACFTVSDNQARSLFRLCFRVSESLPEAVGATKNGNLSQGVQRHTLEWDGLTEC